MVNFIEFGKHLTTEKYSGLRDRKITAIKQLHHKLAITEYSRVTRLRFRVLQDRYFRLDEQVPLPILWKAEQSED